MIGNNSLVWIKTDGWMSGWVDGWKEWKEYLRSLGFLEFNYTTTTTITLRCP